MNLVEDFKKVAQKVFFLLSNNEEVKDNDRLLIAAIWRQEFHAGDFLGALEEGRLSNPETITRMRRKMQEQYPTLRGKKWNVRHNLEEEVAGQMTFFDLWEGKTN